MPGRTIVQWDKDDVATLGFVKFDLLGLGMLTLIDRMLRLIEREHGRSVEQELWKPNDPDIYAMVRKADTIGVFQLSLDFAG